MSRLLKLSILAFMAALIAAPAMARPPTQWVLLGEQRVGLLDEGDVIAVGEGEGPFLSVKVNVSGNDVDIRLLRIRFLSGEEQTVRLDGVIRAGHESPVIDLQGERRGIREILVRYNGRPLFGGRAKVAIWAEKVSAPPPPPPSTSRLDVIDTQSIDSASDRVVFRVGPRDGRLSQIAIRAVDAPLTFRNIQVTFGNGETQNIDVIERLEPGQESRIFDLEGEARAVEQVVIQKRPSWRAGSSRVELLARRRPAPPPPRPAPSAGGYDIVDSQVVDKRSDRVVFRVPRGEGPFTKIKFHAVDDAITFRHIQIVFTNGETQDLDVLERLEPNEESPDIEVVNGERRSIEQVIVTKRPSWKPGESRLQLIGFEPPRRPPPPPPRPAGPPSHGFPPGWVLVGTGTLDRNYSFSGPNSRPGVVTMDVGRDLGLFSSIGIRSVGPVTRIKSVLVVYSNGEPDRIAINQNLQPNARTQPITLKGDRFIRSIEIEYFGALGGKSYVEVYGDYADNWLGERGRRRDFNQGWVMLGSQRAQMISNDVDAFQIGERFGRFRSVRITVRKHAVRFYGMRIVYGSGQAEDVAFSGELTDGQSSPPLDLKGRERFIDRIEIKYRTKLNFIGEGVVEVWGQQ